MKNIYKHEKIKNIKNMLTQEKRSGIMSLVAERYSFTSKKEVEM